MKTIFGLIKHLAAFAIAALPLQSVRAQTHPDSFLVEPNRPIVFLHVLRLGLGLPEEDGQRHERIWFDLHNNCTQTIRVTVTGAPPASPTDDGTVMDQLVRIEASFKIPRNPIKATLEKMPPDTSFDVGSSSTIDPGKLLHFSLPAEQFSREWAIHIPFAFNLPPGKCCRDEAVWGGEAQMFLSFSFFDLPDSIRTELDKARKKK